MGSHTMHFWDKHQHLKRMRASGLFRVTKEIVLHNIEQGGAERLVGLELSQGGVATLLKNGMSEEIGVTALREPQCHHHWRRMAMQRNTSLRPLLTPT
jgi:hypothetical protein